MGRFLQTDPIGCKDDLNLYAYVGNDPLDKTDSSGNAGVDTLFLPDDAPIVVVGQALGGVAAFAVGAVTGNQALKNAAADGLAASREENIGAAVFVLSLGRGEGGGLSQRAAFREAKFEAGIPRSQQPVSQQSAKVGDTKIGRQQTFETPKPGGGTETKSVQVSRDQVGSHAGQPQIEAGTVKPGGQTDAGGRPRIQNETKVRTDFCPTGTRIC